MRSRRAASAVDLLLGFTIVALGAIFAAYIWMPDFQRALGRLADDITARYFPDGG